PTVPLGILRIFLAWLTRLSEKGFPLSFMVKVTPSTGVPMEDQFVLPTKSINSETSRVRLPPHDILRELPRGRELVDALEIHPHLPEAPHRPGVLGDDRRPPVGPPVPSQGRFHVGRVGDASVELSEHWEDVAHVTVIEGDMRVPI